jgi:hypothetical protein
MVRCDFVFGGMFAQAPCSLTSALIQSASYPRSANNIVRWLNSRPLQTGLEAATRALLDPGHRSSVDFSRPIGEAALVSPDSVSWRVFKK